MNDLQAQSSSAMLHVRDLGRMPYATAFELQMQLQREVIDARQSDRANALGTGYLLLVEHDPPVITISRRPDARQHLVATDAQLRAVGVEVAETDRGGDITYHGPGQLVVYPILDLNVLGLRLTSYMRLLEQIVIDTVARFGVEGHRDPAAPGVWVYPRSDAPGMKFDATNQPSNLPAAKIGAMGVRISRWVTMHGLALNLTTNLDHFNLIVPCGLAGRAVTSLQRERGDRCPRMDQVKSVMIERFQQAIRDCMSAR